MPTPESEAFLKKKPTVPPTFNGVDFSDPQAVVDARDAIVREQWIKVMMARLVRQELGRGCKGIMALQSVVAGAQDLTIFAAGKCYNREGVNHLEKCGKYRERYIQLLKETKERGWRGQQQNYVPGVDGPSGGPEITTDFPTVQQAKGTKGSDLRPGNNSGWGSNERY